MADGISRFERAEEDIRRLKLRHPVVAVTDTKTFIVGTTITAALFIPPMYLSVNPDGLTPETKRLIGFWAKLDIGSATVAWLHNGASVHDHAVTTVASKVMLDGLDGRPGPIAIADGDTLRLDPTVVSSSPAPTGLAMAAIFVWGA